VILFAVRHHQRQESEQMQHSSHGTTGKSSNLILRNDDQQYLPNPMPPTNDNDRFQPHLSPKQHYQSANPILEVSVVIMWSLVIIVTIYYIVTEKQRKRQRLRRQRQERLEHYSPEAQKYRALELHQILEQTTIVVRETDLFWNHSEGSGHSSRDVETGTRNGQFGNYDHCANESGNSDPYTDDSTTRSNNQEYTDSRSNDLDDQTESLRASEFDMDHHNEVQHLCETPQVDMQSVHGLDTNAGNKSEKVDGDEEEDELILQIPTVVSANSPYRQVSALCVICLKQYQPNDRVTWSTNHLHDGDNHNDNNDAKDNTTARCCCHVFHQHCIVEWLAKLPGCNCPVCRNMFCHLPPSCEQTTLSV